MGCVHQKPALNMNLSVLENVKYYLKVFGIVNSTYIGSLFKALNIDLTDKRKVRHSVKLLQVYLMI